MIIIVVSECSGAVKIGLIAEVRLKNYFKVMAKKALLACFVKREREREREREKERVLKKVLLA